MRKLGERRSRALFVAGMATLAVGLSGCGIADPVSIRPGGDAGGPAPVSGEVLTGTAGISGVAGISGTAAVSGGVAGTPVVAGSAASGGTSGSGPVAGTTGSLPPFNGGDASLNAVQPGAVCARLAALDCAGEAHCCNNPGRTVAQCEADQMMSCTQTFYIDSLSQNPITGFDKATAQMEFTVLQQKASQCDLSVAAWATSVDGLFSMFKGTVAPGKSCKPAAQSITDMDKPTVGASLASCSGITTTACLPQSALGSWTCAPHNAVGGACLSDVNCKDGLFCSNPAKKFLGQCATHLAVGTACTINSQCASQFCKNGACVAADQQVAYCLKTN